jgi:SP family sugar:H+ symporter-like MFS transporter
LGPALIFQVSFGPYLYQQNGIGNMAFTYNLIARVLNLVFSLPVAWLYDKFGRRPLLFIGTFFAMIWLIMLGALGGQTELTETALKAVVASVILLQVGCYLGLSQGCWIVGPEIGSALLRRKSELDEYISGIKANDNSYGSGNHRRYTIWFRGIIR